MPNKTIYEEESQKMVLLSEDITGNLTAPSTPSSSHSEPPSCVSQSILYLTLALCLLTSWLLPFTCCCLAEFFLNPPQKFCGIQASARKSVHPGNHLGWASLGLTCSGPAPQCRGWACWWCSGCEDYLAGHRDKALRVIMCSLPGFLSKLSPSIFQELKT